MGSVELQRQAQRVVDCFQLVAAHVADEFTQTLWGYRGGLLDEYLRLFASDGDRGAKDTGRR